MHGNQLFKLRQFMTKRITIGTRGSKLALWQANWVKSQLKEHHAALTVDLVIIKTKGDKILDVPLAKVGGKGLFVKEIEDSLLRHHIDIAVHSMKDMPADFPEGLGIGAVPERENANDVLVSRYHTKLKDLNPGSKIGTSSLRRSAQLKHALPELQIVPLRGNLDTRLKKLKDEDLDAIVLAAAGLKRLNLEDEITEIIGEDVIMPAAGQGALCVEIRNTDSETAEMVSALDHPETRKSVIGERAFLKRLGGSCQVPIAAKGNVALGKYVLSGLIASVDGSSIIKDTVSGPLDQSEDIGIHLAEALLSKGADTILREFEIEAYGNNER